MVQGLIPKLWLAFIWEQIFCVSLGRCVSVFQVEVYIVMCSKMVIEKGWVGTNTAICLDIH